MEINIKDYLSDGELKEIAEQEFRNMIRNRFAIESETNRIISNLCYQFVWDMVDQKVNGNLDIMLKEKIINIITNLSEFSLFRRKDAWENRILLDKRF